MGLRILAVQEQIRFAKGDRWRSRTNTATAHSGRQHRAGLVLVERMGELVFNEKYPDPKGMIDDSASQSLPFDDFCLAVLRSGVRDVRRTWTSAGILSTAPRLQGFHPQGTALYDAFNPERAQVLLEPDRQRAFSRSARTPGGSTRTSRKPKASRRASLVNEQVALGNGARYATMYPLMTTRRRLSRVSAAASEQKRVFILSRSAVRGIQRNAVTAWSGDVESNWMSFARQIPAGLNFRTFRHSLLDDGHRRLHPGPSE